MVQPLALALALGALGLSLASCYHNVLRDNLLQSYHQYVFAGERWP